MASAKERLKVFENIIARVGLDGDVLGEYSKAMSSLNGLQTYNELNPPIPQNLPPQQSMGGDIPTVAPEMGQSTATEEIMP